MQFKITNIGGGGADTAQISLQELRDAATDEAGPVPTPMPVSTIQLVVPISEVQNYVFGGVYEIELTQVAKKATTRRGGAQ